MDNSGVVRRIDINLRGFYPEIKTTIYQTEVDTFVIYCNCSDQRLAEVKNTFDDSIKPITAPVTISNLVPKNIIKEISPISDKEIAKNFEGISMSAIDLLNILVSKFPNVHFSRVELTAPMRITIYTGEFAEIINGEKHLKFLNNRDRDSILTFVNGLKIPVEFFIQEEKVDTKPDLTKRMAHSPIQYLYAPGFMRGKIPDYCQRDEAIWFDNIDKIFSGQFQKKDLFFYSPDEFCCYADYSGFENIDLRNFLFLFQCAYITIPFERNIKKWLAERKITEEEFFYLVKRNRIKVILIQPEMRHDIGFLNAVYAANPNAIITRRALHALVQTDIVNLSDNYIFNDQNILDKVREFAEAAGKIINVESEYLYNVMVWPMQARRRSFQQLNYGGPFGFSSFGVNNAIEKNYSKIFRRDLSFEFTISAPAIHIANALNATYFPIIEKGGFSDYYYASVMGEMLNLYRHFTPQNVKSYIDEKKKLATGILPISPIELIEVNDYISITELEQVLNYDQVFPNSKRLMETLADLSDSERKKKIAYYNNEVKKSNRKIIGNGAVDLGENVALDALGMYTGVSILGTLYSLLKIGGKKIKKVMNPVLDKMESALNDSNVDKANIHFLSRINRVAKLKDRSETT